MTSLGFAIGRPYPPVTSAAAGKRPAPVITRRVIGDATAIDIRPLLNFIFIICCCLFNLPY